MAIDSKEKRVAVLGVGRPWMRDKFPVATPDEEWRVASGNAYGGNITQTEPFVQRRGAFRFDRDPFKIAEQKAKAKKKKDQELTEQLVREVKIALGDEVSLLAEHLDKNAQNIQLGEFSQGLNIALLKRQASQIEAARLSAMDEEDIEVLLMVA